ncbi:hypothetical protein ACET3Z_003646 [Daucus carota]
MASTAARLASKLLRPGVLQPKIEMHETSTRTPFSAVAPCRRFNQSPVIVSRFQPQKNLETIFEEESTCCISKVT